MPPSLIRVKQTEEAFVLEMDADGAPENEKHEVIISKRDFGLSSGRAFRMGVRKPGKTPSFWKQPDRVFPRLTALTQ